MIDNHFSDGVWPVMLTPFKGDKSVDWDGVDALTDWYVSAGVSGLFAVSQSSEMYALDDSERLALASRVVERSKGRLPVVAAGTFGGTIEEQAEFTLKMYDTGVKAVVVITSQVAREDESESVWLRHMDEFLGWTVDVPLGLYECPAPYKRLLSPELMKWAAETKRFAFHKDTCLSIATIREKIVSVTGTSLKFFNAEVSSLRESLLAGGNGFSGIASNFYPKLLVWLCKHYSDQAEEAQCLQHFLSVAECVLEHKYPVSAKYYLRMSGQLDILPVCRAQEMTLTEHDQRTLLHLFEYQKSIGHILPLQ